MRAIDCSLAMIVGLASLSPVPAGARELRTPLHGQSDIYRHAIECAGTSEFLWGAFRDAIQQTSPEMQLILRTMNQWKDFAIQLGEASADDTEWDQVAQSYDMSSEWNRLRLADSADGEAYLLERVEVFKQCASDPPA